MRRTLRACVTGFHYLTTGKVRVEDLYWLWRFNSPWQRLGPNL
jgi:hypothetical protein